MYRRSCDNSTALEICASSSNLSDADAAEVAAVLISIGSVKRNDRERTIKIAESRGKSKLIAVLNDCKDLEDWER